jgi:hypothetical protein
MFMQDLDLERKDITNTIFLLQGDALDTAKIGNQSARIQITNK